MSNTIGYSLGGCVTAARYNLTQGEDSTGNTVVFSLPACVPAIGTESVSLDTVSRFYTPTLIGFSEYVDPSSPPRKYRTKTSTPSPGYRAVYSFSCAGPLYGSDGGYREGYEQYNAMTGAFTTTARLKIRQTFGSEPPVAVISDIPTTFPTTPLVNDAECTATSGKTFTQALAGTDCYYEFSTGLWYTFKNGHAQRYDLTDEDTEADAIARATPTVGTGAVASRTARTTGFGFNLTTVEALLHCSNLRSEFLYRVRYDIKETNLTTSAVTLTPYEVDVPALSVSYDLATITLSPNPGFSQELVNHSISIL